MYNCIAFPTGALHEYIGWQRVAMRTEGSFMKSYTIKRVCVNALKDRDVN